MTQSALQLSQNELKLQRSSVRNANVEYRQTLSRLERFAMWITKRVGSPGFFLVIVIWTAAWLVWNATGPKHLRFDPFPAFVMWLFISNMIQIFLMPLIMIGQNLQARHSEARAEADYRVNVKAEREIEAVMAHLEEQRALLQDTKQSLERR